MVEVFRGGVCNSRLRSVFSEVSRIASGKIYFEGVGFRFLLGNFLLRGLGSCVFNRLSFGGAVRLENRRVASSFS